MAGKGGAIPAAPEAMIRDIAAAYVELIGSLDARDPALCARFVTGRLEGARPSRATLVRLDRIAALRIRAARAGEDRPAPGPSEEDRRALIAEAARIDPASAALLAGNGLDRASPAEQCRAGLAIYRAAASAPGRGGAWIVAGYSH